MLRAVACGLALLLLGCPGDAPTVSDARRPDSGADGGGGADLTPSAWGETLCEPCAADDECGGAADRCLPYEESAACGQDCENRACPSPFQCLRVRTVSDEWAQQCVPPDGDCAGVTRPDAGSSGDGSVGPANDGGGACSSWSGWSCSTSLESSCRANCGGMLVSCSGDTQCFCGPGQRDPCGTFGGEGCEICEAAVAAGCCAR